MKFITMVFKRAKRAFKPKAKRVFKKKNTIVSKSVKRYVAKTIARKAEHKMVTLTGEVTALPAPVGLTPALTQKVCIPISQGTNVSARIGNQVTITKVVMRYALGYSYSTTTGNPTYNIPFNVRMYIGSTINNPYAQPSATDYQSFFKLQNTAVGFDNTLLTLCRPINTDYWNIKIRKAFKVGNATCAPDAIINAAQVTNNDYRSAFFGTMDITKVYKRHALFNDNSQDAFNQGQWLMLGCTDQAGSAATYAAACVRMTYEIDFHYIDE